MGNLRKLRKSWEHFSVILVQEGSKPRVLGVLFKAVVQVVLLFGSETWVMTPCMGRLLGGGGVQHRLAIHIIGSQPRWSLDIIWQYPPLEAAMQEAGFE